MTTPKQINSSGYWDSRFADDWESFDGPAQSRFFAQLAIKHLPTWLLDQIKKQSLTVADWGCALGDGTDVWASYIGAERLTGIDFSAEAIEQAAQRYPVIRFLNQDWLIDAAQATEKFDVVFCSNTLEHFHRPFDVLRELGAHARKAVVLALPYKELDRIDEHFYTFLPDNIPLALDNGFRLVWSHIIDCRPIPNAHWTGQQAFLVYADSSWLDSLKLTLLDSRVVSDDLFDKLEHQASSVHKYEEKISNLVQTLAQISEQISVAFLEREDLVRQHAIQTQLQSDNFALQLQQRQQMLADLEARIARSDSLLEERGKQISELNAKLHEVSAWGQRMERSPIVYAAKKYIRLLIRLISRCLPISMHSKQTIKRKLLSLASRIRSTAQLEILPIAQDMEGPPPRISRPAIRDIFVFSVIDWHFRIQRPQHLARSFAHAGRRVFFFSNNFVDTTEPGYQIEQLDATGSLYQIKLHVRGAPTIYFAPPTADAEEMLKASIAKVISDFSAISAIAIVQHAYWYPLVKCLPNTYRIYDCMDHHEGFGNVPERLIEIEKDMLEHADLVVTTSTWLEEFARTYNSRVALIRNAGEYDHFAHRPADIYVDSQNRKIIGYYGAIAEWFDIDLIRAIAVANADHLVLLVGNDSVDARAKLADLKNVLFTGEVSYERLPFYLYAFDVCLLPFKVIPLTLATNPVKVYEYLAAGKPVVCVDLPEISQFRDLVWSAASYDEFLRCITEALQPGASTPERVDPRKSFAAGQTWNHRIAELDDALVALRMPKISVVVLTYNNLELTQACLKSLVEETDYPNLEIIIVDNASSDDTPNYLREFGAQHANVNIILNESNLGFAAGNNIGLAAATGDYLAVLNNDTVVTCGWALTLMRHLQADPSIGLLGPITNNIGNEARVAMKYTDLDDMPSEAFQRTLKRMGRTFAVHNAAFFCVMLPRATYDRCGPICEEYGRGFFEDDDYCREAEAAGLRIACAEDVFVHHQLSASFGKLPSAEKESLFARNKALYEKKWGQWTPHQYRVPSNRKNS